MGMGLNRLRGISPYLLITLAWGISVVSKLKFNGLVYGLDFGLYHPDGVHYTLRTLVWLGHTPLEAAEQISNWYANHSAKQVIINPQSILPENSPVWGLVKPRLLYPFLSLPFVSIFGIPGMLAIPALSLLVTMIIIFKLASLKLSPTLGTVFATSLVLSPTILRWSAANLTDPLSMALFSFVALLLCLENKTWKFYFIFSLLILLTEINRFCLPIWLAIGLYLFIRKNYRLSIFTLIISILFSIPTLLQGSSVGLLPSEDSGSVYAKVLLLPMSFVKIAIVEMGQLAVLDRFLLATLVAAAFSSIRYLENTSSQLFLCVALAVWALGAINGVIGVNFRYQLPLIPFLYWVLISSEVTRKIDRVLIKSR
jgi:hypothetical protein